MGKGLRIFCLYCLSLVIAVFLLPNVVARDSPYYPPVRVKAAVIRNFLPDYGIDEQGNPIGFAVDVLQAVASRAGLNITYQVEDSLLQAEQALLSAEVDLIPTRAITKRRERIMSFTTPITTFPLSIFVRRADEQIQSQDDLIGKRIGVIEGNVGYEFMEGKTGVKLEVFRRPETALFNLLAGHLDAVVYPEPVFISVARAVNLEHRIKTVGKPLLESKRAIALRKDNTVLLERLNPVIEEFIQTPEYQKIYQKWYGRSPQIWTKAQILWFIGGIVLVSSVVVLIWRVVSLSYIRRLKQLNAQIETSEALYRGIVEDRTELICRFLPVGKEKEIIVEGLAVDITDYKQAIIELQKAHKQLSFHLENSPVAVIEWDEDFRVRSWSARAEQIFGWKAEEVLGKNCREWQFIYEDDLESVNQCMHRLGKLFPLTILGLN